MRQSWIAMFIFLTVILAFFEIGRHEAEAGVIALKRMTREARRLCSSNLSDTLELVCKPLGGFNSQFAESGDADGAASGGIVNECCYNPCSIKQMEAYCKNKPK
ncbi:hypothetical protein QAD02_011757 [Eretmocerus hayati]|uniref:Uncharacterized protein n=1 Tax=Eretmocerus hayati TaxID=131215 RepID=A0ACC2NZG0_9HYME|nr:hypothetical protein QAD02_011757 [Eretmocerus hayati]